MIVASCTCDFRGGGFRGVGQEKLEDVYYYTVPVSVLYEDFDLNHDGNQNVVQPEYHGLANA